MKYRDRNEIIAQILESANGNRVRRLVSSNTGENASQKELAEASSNSVVAIRNLG